MSVRVEKRGVITVVEIARPGARNAIDGRTAEALTEAFREFSREDTQRVAVLTGAGGTFCAGADLKAIGQGRGNRVEAEGDGPLGPTRMLLPKPCIAAVEGYAVAGGLELALWCDLRVAAKDAIFGVFCRRFGVPLIDGGTVRLPRLIGTSRALDMILTGRAVGAEEGLGMGLVNRVCEPGEALSSALLLAEEIANWPQDCMRNDRLSVYEQEGYSLEDALSNEFQRGISSLSSPEFLPSVSRFLKGDGRHGGRPGGLGMG